MSVVANQTELDFFGPASVGLTDRQKRFCLEYVADCNAAQAAGRSGYAGSNLDQIGWQLMLNPQIKAVVQKLNRELMERLYIEAYQVVKELAAVAFSNISHYKADPETGEITVPSGHESALRALKATKCKTTRKVRLDSDGGETTETQTSVEISLWNKIEALKLLGQRLNMFGPDRSVNEGPTCIVLKGFDPDYALGLKRSQDGQSVVHAGDGGAIVTSSGADSQGDGVSGGGASSSSMHGN